jgi:hypothetical protein
MSMTEAEFAAFGCPGAAAIVRCTQAGAPLVRLLVAVHDSRSSAEASTEWATVTHGGDQAGGLASQLFKGGGFSRQHAFAA